MGCEQGGAGGWAHSALQREHMQRGAHAAVARPCACQAFRPSPVATHLRRRLHIVLDGLQLRHPGAQVGQQRGVVCTERGRRRAGRCSSVASPTLAHAERMQAIRTPNLVPRCSAARPAAALRCAALAALPPRPSLPTGSGGGSGMSFASSMSWRTKSLKSPPRDEAGCGGAARAMEEGHASGRQLPNRGGGRHSRSRAACLESERARTHSPRTLSERLSDSSERRPPRFLGVSASAAPPAKGCRVSSPCRPRSSNRRAMTASRTDSASDSGGCSVQTGGRGCE